MITQRKLVYPFGYGLSYTTFDWSNMQTTWSGDECTVTVDVENTGDMAGKDVVENLRTVPIYPSTTKQTE